MEQTDTRTYHDYTIVKRYLCGDFIYTKGNEMVLPYSDLFQR